MSSGEVPPDEPRTMPRPLGTLHEAILTALDRHRRRPGVALIAFDQRNVVLGECWIEARPGEARCALVGRHRACDLVLPGACTELELRHLVVLAHHSAPGELRVRVVELQAAAGRAHRAAQASEAVTASSPWMLAVGPLWLALLPTGEVHEPAVGSWPGHALRMTVQRAAAGAIADAARPGDDGEAIGGRLTVSAMGTSRRHQVGEHALARGILIGRDARCDLETGVASAMVSRVHLLVVRVAGELLAIDAGSRNGTYRDGEQVALCRLTSGSVLDLGGGGHVQVLWEEERVASSERPGERTVVSPPTPG